MMPKQSVAIPVSEIKFENDPSTGYEIISLTGIDLDSAIVTDVEHVTKQMFQLPPR